MSNTAIFWFRRDLRLHDNAGLYHALKNHSIVLPLFIFDTEILSDLQSKNDARVTFIYQQLTRLNQQLKKLGSSLFVKIGKPETVWKDIVENDKISAVYTNTDYEPYAKKRDESVNELLTKKGIGFYRYKDHVIFEKNEVLKNDNKPYTVFTPYMKKWKTIFFNQSTNYYPVNEVSDRFFNKSDFDFPSLLTIGFEENDMDFPEKEMNEEVIKNYHLNRDFPARQGTSQLGIHLRFGTISIRQVVEKARRLNEIWLNELIWREFFMAVLYHFPYVETKPFRQKYDAIPWRNKPDEFEKWCKGFTGYPIVDAGMRELNKTGYMHNRVRMITAGFLTKHLLIDWRWGEAYFAEKLLDYELASNNGNWQWAAGTGCDAAPYFRVFNPYTQSKKFDPEMKYIKKWVPEVNSIRYPEPIVEHKFARQRAIDTYKKSLS